MLTFKTTTPSSCGIVEIDDQHIVEGFHGKYRTHLATELTELSTPSSTPCWISSTAWAPPPSDFSTEVIPSLIGRIQTWHTNQAYLDIGTPEALATARTAKSMAMTLATTTESTFAMAAWST